jgi:transposase-like protein
MATTARELRDLIATTSSGTHRKHVPAEVKAEAIRFAERRRAAGASWAVVGRELAVDPTRLRSWALKRQRGSPASLLRPVQVVPEARGRSELVVVTPGGFRIEGVSVPDAAELLRLLA